MLNKEKYCGIIPAFYACYDEEGNISPERIRAFVRQLIKKGIKGLYVGGSSGECIYQNPEERELVLETVMEEAKGKITVIAHIACNNTRDSVRLAAHAESVGVDAIAAIPPIYFRLPNYAIADYWNSMSKAAPNTDFIIYNIPQLAGVALTGDCLKEMLKNPRVIGVKNSSLAAMDIQSFKTLGGENFVVFNGPDEQLLSGLAAGAIGGIGGTYGAMPEVYIAIKKAYDEGDLVLGRKIQEKANEIISAMCSCHGHMYAAIKEIIKRREGISLGGVREPLPNLLAEDMPKIEKCIALIDEAYEMIK